MRRMRSGGFSKAFLAIAAAAALLAPNAALALVCLADCNVSAGTCPNPATPPAAAVTVSDATQALNYATAIQAQPGAGTDAAINCNVNAAGTVDVGDAVLILRWESGLAGSFPNVNNRWDIMAWDTGVWGN